MNIPFLVFKSIRQHSVSTFVTVISLALATGLMLTVWILQSQSQKVFAESNSGYDAVLGARGSKLQLVLNCLYHLEQSPGNIDWQDYLDIKNDKRVAKAVPIAVGDNLYGFRIVGTTTNIFSSYEAPKLEGFKIQRGGRAFSENRMEAVIGSYVAQSVKGLKVGSTFRPYHGLRFDPKDQHSEEYVVTGIMEPTNSPADRAVWIPITGVQNMKGHSVESSEQISGVLLKLVSPTVGQMLDLKYNRQGNRLTLAWPVARIVSELFNKISWFDRLLQGIAMLVGLVASGSVLASVYNSMNERKRDIAIMRALGASRSKVVTQILSECGFIGIAGSFVGILFYAILMQIGSEILREKTGIVLSIMYFHSSLILVPICMTVASILAGILPAFKAYRSSVAENILPTT